MTRISSRFRPLAWAWSGAILAPALVVSACTGKVSLGGNGTTRQAVSTSDVSGTVGACPSGSAHPNVCCTAGPGQATACGVYPGTPFEACASDEQTYPDPRSCCDLSGDNACTAASAAPSGSDSNPGTIGNDVDAGVNGTSPSTGPSGGGACAYPCPVGYFAPADAAPGECCTAGPGNTQSCFTPASTGEDCPVCACSCPACPAGAPCAPCPPCECPPMPSGCGTTAPSGPPQCGACPPGWQQPEDTPGLCCRQDPANGAIQCFSQAVPPPPPSSSGSSGSPGNPDTPISSPPSMGVACSGGGGGPDGGSTGCSCQETVGANTYALVCPATGDCACTVNGKTVSQVANTMCVPAAGAGVFDACGFAM